MSPETRLHGVVLGITVAFMFFVVTKGQAFLAELDDAGLLIGAGVAFLVSVGFYKSLAATLLLLLRHVGILKKWILGPSYLEGTWAGILIGKTGLRRIIVEHYEQNPFELVVRGKSFTEDGAPHAEWYTLSTRIEEQQGILYCFYQTRILHRPAPVDGIGRLTLLRSRPNQASSRMSGHVVDTDNGVAMPINELMKLSDDMLPWSEAIDQFQTEMI